MTGDEKEDGVGATRVHGVGREAPATFFFVISVVRSSAVEYGRPREGSPFTGGHQRLPTGRGSTRVHWKTRLIVTVVHGEDPPERYWSKVSGNQECLERLHLSPSRDENTRRVPHQIYQHGL